MQTSCWSPAVCVCGKTHRSTEVQRSCLLVHFSSQTALRHLSLVQTMFQKMKFHCFPSINASHLIASFLAAVACEDPTECLSPSDTPPRLPLHSPACSPRCLRCHPSGVFCCHIPSLLTDAAVLPSSKHSWRQLDIPLVQNISSHNLISDDPVLERYLCLESQRSRIPF